MPERKLPLDAPGARIIPSAATGKRRHNSMVVIVGDVAYVDMTRGAVALVDAADAEFVAQYAWHLSPSRGAGYARRGWHDPERPGRPRSTAMHNDLMNPPPGLEVDHVNGDGLDNRRSNLRVCTRFDNMRNRGPMRTSSVGFKGVRRDKYGYIAEIRPLSGRRYLGLFPTPEEAAVAYDRAAIELFGEFAHTNILVNTSPQDGL